MTDRQLTPADIHWNFNRDFGLYSWNIEALQPGFNLFAVETDWGLLQCDDKAVLGTDLAAADAEPIRALVEAAAAKGDCELLALHRPAGGRAGDLSRLTAVVLARATVQKAARRRLGPQTLRGMTAGLDSYLRPASPLYRGWLPADRLLAVPGMRIRQWKHAVTFEYRPDLRTNLEKGVADFAATLARGTMLPYLFGKAKGD